MTIAQRLYVLIGAASLGLIVIAGLNMYQMGKVYEAANWSNVNVVPSMVILDKAVSESGKLRVFVLRYAVNTDPGKIAGLETKVNDADAGLTKALKSYEVDGCGGVTCFSDDKDRALMAADKAAYEAYHSGVVLVMDAARRHENDKAIELFSKNAANAEALGKVLDDHMQYNVEITSVRLN